MVKGIKAKDKEEAVALSAAAIFSPLIVIKPL